jgi:hypothetical protein
MNTRIQKIEKYKTADSRETQNFIVHHKHLLKFVDWTTNTIYLRTDIKQPQYLTNPDEFVAEYDDHVAQFLLK